MKRCDLNRHLCLHAIRRILINRSSVPVGDFCTFLRHVGSHYDNIDATTAREK